MQNFFSKEINKDYKKETYFKYYGKILTTMLPIIPHFASECLRLLNINSLQWPEYDEKLIKEETIPYVIQFNGKKRAIIINDRDISEDKLIDLIKKDEKLKKYFVEEKVKKKIFISNKLINIIT